MGWVHIYELPTSSFLEEGTGIEDVGEDAGKGVEVVAFGVEVRKRIKKLCSNLFLIKGRNTKKLQNSKKKFKTGLPRRIEIYEY